MSSYSRSVWAVVAALIVIFVGLFLVCAQRRGTVAGGDDMANNDDQFRQELLQLLDLTEDESGQKSDSGDTQVADSQDEQNADEVALTDEEMLALLGADNESGDETGGLEESAPPREKQTTSGKESAAGRQTLETEPTTTAANLGLTPAMFEKIRTDISKLESDLERRSAMVDSLQSIITNRNARLQELENRKAAAPRPPVTPRKTTSAPAVPSVFNTAYETARGKFESRRYQEAITDFEKLLSDYPDHNMADNCQYWIGECWFGLREYQKAVVEFKKVFAYSEIDKHDDAQLMIGLSLVRSGQEELAQKEFASFLDSFANSEYASVARRYYRNI